MQLVFATNNKDKIYEVAKLISANIRLLSLNDIGCNESIIESGTTFQENALIKARYVSSKYKVNCFADDSGLEVEALNGRPGVHSARYSGEDRNDDRNNQKLLKELINQPNREAGFVTVIALILNGEEYIFEGTVNGRIATECKGKEGFGYDPLFIPEGHNKTFAEMQLAEKNKISHRARAVNKLVNFLNKTTA